MDDRATLRGDVEAHAANKDEAADGMDNELGEDRGPTSSRPRCGTPMVSHANMKPGLTKAWTWVKLEQHGTAGTRNYARVITIDDYQGRGGAASVEDLTRRSDALIIMSTRPTARASARRSRTRRRGHASHSSATPRRGPASSRMMAFFQAIKASKPGPPVRRGHPPQERGQTIKYKVAVLAQQQGQVDRSDGFTGHPDLDKLPQGRALYLSFAVLSSTTLARPAAPARSCLDAYKAKFGEDPLLTDYALTGRRVGIPRELSQGDRRSRRHPDKGVLDQVFSGSGITIGARLMQRQQRPSCISDRRPETSALETSPSSAATVRTRKGLKAWPCS